MVFIGIDQSVTSTGIIAINEAGNILKNGLIKTVPSDKKRKYSYEERFTYIISEVNKFIEEFQNPIIFLEGISYHSISQRAAQQGALHWLIVMMLYTNSKNYTVVPPSVHKKFITGKGNANKELVKETIILNYKIEFDSYDLYDAFSIAEYARSLNKEN